MEFKFLVTMNDLIWNHDALGTRMLIEYKLKRYQNTIMHRDVCLAEIVADFCLNPIKDMYWTLGYDKGSEIEVEFESDETNVWIIFKGVTSLKSPSQMYYDTRTGKTFIGEKDLKIELPEKKELPSLLEYMKQRFHETIGSR